jgi:maltooligosyltrehalose trehalohydrolase
MGEEYGETAQFLYFTSHGDPELAEAVRFGRKSEFTSFGWQGDVPDPQAESTFEMSKLNHSAATEDPHKTLQEFYRMLLKFRSEHRLGHLAKPSVTGYEASRAVLALYESKSDRFAMIFNFGAEPATLNIELPQGFWNNRICSATPQWLGNDWLQPLEIHVSGQRDFVLQPQSFLVLQHSNTRALAE